MEPSVAQELPIRYSLGCTLYRNENFGGKRFQISRQTRIPIYIIFQVSTWPEKYGCDGIDLDLEEGAGAKYVNFSRFCS